MLLFCTSASSPLQFGVVWAGRLVYYFIYFLKCSLPNNTTACLLDRAKKDTHSRWIKAAAAKSQILREKVSLELSFPFRLCPYRHITLSRNQLVCGWERLDGKKSVERKRGRELRLRVTKLVQVNNRAKHVIGLAKKGARQSLDCRTKAIQGHITLLLLTHLHVLSSLLTFSQSGDFGLTFVEVTLGHTVGYLLQYKMRDECLYMNSQTEISGNKG